MRKIVWALVTCALLMAAPVQLASASEQGFAVSYHQSGPGGELIITNAPGASFYAIDSAGQMVASGVVAGEWFSVSAGNSGPDSQGRILRVTIGGQQIQLSANEWWHWE